MPCPALAVSAFALLICAVHAFPTSAIFGRTPTIRNPFSVATDNQVTINDYISGVSDNGDRNVTNTEMKINNYDQVVESSNHRDENEDYGVIYKKGRSNPQSTTNYRIKRDDDNSEKSFDNGSKGSGNDSKNKRNGQNFNKNANTAKIYFPGHKIYDISYESAQSPDIRKTHGYNTETHPYFGDEDNSDKDKDIGNRKINHSEKDNNHPNRSNIREEINRNVKTGKNIYDSNDSKINIRPEVQEIYWDVSTNNKISHTTKKFDTNTDNLDEISSNNNQDSNDSKIHQNQSNEEDNRNIKTKNSSDHPHVPNDNDSESQEVQHPYWEVADSRNSDEKKTEGSNNNDETGKKTYSNWTVTDVEPQNNKNNYETKTSVTQRSYSQISTGQDQRNEYTNNNKHIRENIETRKKLNNHRSTYGKDTTDEDDSDDKSKQNRNKIDDESDSGSNEFISQQSKRDKIAQDVESGESEQNNNKRFGANNHHHTNTNKNHRPNWEDFNRQNQGSDENGSNTVNKHSRRNEYSKEVSSRNSNKDNSEERYEDQNPYGNNHRYIKDKGYINNTPDERKVYTKPGYDKPCNSCSNRHLYNKNKGSEDKNRHRHYHENNKYSYHKHGNRVNNDDKNSNKCEFHRYNNDRKNSNTKHHENKYNNNYNRKYDRHSHIKYGDGKHQRNSDFNNKYKKGNGAGYKKGNYNSKSHSYNHKNHDRNHKNIDRYHKAKYDGGHYKKIIF